MPKLFAALLFAGMLPFIAGCRSAEAASSGEVKFRRFFCWGVPNTEANARKYAEAGVTDIEVKNRKQFDLARKYGMTPYWKCFTPAGPYPQVVTPEEEKYFAYISGRDLDPKMPKAERLKILHRRRIEKQHRYGGEQVVEVDTQSKPIPCFVSDDGLRLTREKLDKLMKDAPEGVAGMFLDFIGYTNHHGCFCEKCLAKYRKFLAGKKLADTPESKKLFYREKLVDYYNAVITYIKSKHPAWKIALHIYPDFRDDHLYGNRIKADYCHQTVAWYFKWEEPKIRKYTKSVVGHAKDFYPHAEGIPFLGLSTDESSSLGYKTPADVERELKIILSAGGRTLSVCSGSAIIEPGYHEVFRKYCGKASPR
ncbi:MAG: hypothetical protein IJT50_09025 [Lentisphaeria bacterium]|nr:hypothetical protein [Lentisphaeria bacterium]